MRSFQKRNPRDSEADRDEAPHTEGRRTNPGKTSLAQESVANANLHARGRPSSRQQQKPRGHGRAKKIAHPRSPMLQSFKTLGEESVTDPEPDTDSGRATVRNMRSKCRCSYVLQFTFRRAVRCVLHRPPSQVIHCAAWSLQDSTSFELL